ncbi:MAG TPA: ABC transporter ATP-binding protein [Longimicrobium sp.]
MSTGLCIREIHAGFGQKEVLHGITLEVGRGEIVAVLGPNGAGKSTLLHVAAGVLTPRRGSVCLDGRDVTALPAHERVRLGLAYAMQGGRIFPSLSVREHLTIGPAGDALTPAGERRLLALKIFPVLRTRLDVRAGLLSGGERQALAVAMALVRCRSVLLLDEPSAGVAPAVAHGILDAVPALAREAGLGVLLVEQNVTGALRVASRAVVLVAGRTARQTDHPQDWLHKPEGFLDLYWERIGDTAVDHPSSSTSRSR